MNNQIIREPARLLFHLNGYSKVLLERTANVGLADGGIVREISTEIIPSQLRKIGSRFLIEYVPLNQDGINDAAFRDAKKSLTAECAGKTLRITENIFSTPDPHKLFLG